MLPFTKRPGRGGEDGEVFTKDDLDDLALTNEKPNAAPSSRSVPPPPVSVRPGAGKPDDFGDDEVTNFIPSKSISSIVHDARKSAAVPPPPASRRAPASVPPPPMSQRPGKFLTGADEDEDGRTVVRGAPKIVKKSAPAPMSAPSSMSPAAVIKATLESARAAKRAHEGALMPPPPAELLEDMTDRLAADDPRVALANRVAQATHAVPAPPPSQRPPMLQSPYTAPMGMTPVGVSELGATMLAGIGTNGPHAQPPSSRGPMTGPPPPMHLAHGGFPNAPASGNIPPPAQSYRSFGPPSQTGPQQQMGASSMPAHFMVPNAPYSDGRMDPPGTSVTARHRTPGRPASAWAMALVAAGLFVGVGAVAVMQSNDSLMDTTASFVDPSRAAAKPAAAAAPAADPAAEPAPQPTTAVAPTVVVPPAGTANDQPAAPPVAANNPPAAGDVNAPTAAAPAQPEAKAADAKAGAGAVAANTPPAAAKAPWAAPTVAPAPKPQPPPVVAAPPPAPKPAAPPKPAVAANDDPPAEKPTKPTKGGKPAAAKGDATDEETKKALEALQKAQLESGF